MNIKTSIETITLSVWDSGGSGFHFNLAEEVNNMYWSLPGVVSSQELRPRGIQIEVEYQTYLKIGKKHYNELMKKTHQKIVEMDELYTTNKQLYDNL